MADELKTTFRISSFEVQIIQLQHASGETLLQAFIGLLQSFSIRLCRTELGAQLSPFLPRLRDFVIGFVQSSLKCGCCLDSLRVLVLQLSKSLLQLTKSLLPDFGLILQGSVAAL